MIAPTAAKTRTTAERPDPGQGLPGRLAQWRIIRFVLVPPEMEKHP
jgi:hypothetical protein